MNGFPNPDTAREIRLERLTSPEVAAALDEGYTTVVVACGAVEQHGPHLPLFVDAEHGDRLALEIARRLGDALVAPTIRVGCSEHHMAFAGTVSLSRSTFLALCEDYCASLARHGVRRVAFVPTHGGNFAPLREGLSGLREAAGPDCDVVAYTDLAEVIGTWRATVEEGVGLGERVGGHADIAETSIMLALHPELVRLDRAERGHVTDPDELGALVDRMIREGFHAVTANGILGDARGAESVLGERLIEAMAEVVVAALGASTDSPSETSSPESPPAS